MHHNYMDPMGMFKGVSSSREPSSGPMLGQESPFLTILLKGLGKQPYISWLWAVYDCLFLCTLNNHQPLSPQQQPAAGPASVVVASAVVAVVVDNQTSTRFKQERNYPP